MTVPLGWLLPGGLVHLDRGVEVEGVYWESLDRILYENGTIRYKAVDIGEAATVVFGTVGGGGAVTTIPDIGETAVTLDLLRSLNLNKDRAGGEGGGETGEEDRKNKRRVRQKENNSFHSKEKIWKVMQILMTGNLPLHCSQRFMCSLLKTMEASITEYDNKTLSINNTDTYDNYCSAKTISKSQCSFLIAN